MKTKAMQKSTKYVEKKRVLISVSVVGSAGPIRMLVNQDDPAGRVMDAALKVYARLGRIPVLGSDHGGFVLCYYDHGGSHAVLGGEETVGESGARSFVLAKKPVGGPGSGPGRGAAGGRWKAWVHKSLSFNIMSH